MEEAVTTLKLYDFMRLQIFTVTWRLYQSIVLWSCKKGLFSSTVYSGTDVAPSSAKDSRMLVGEKTDGSGTGIDVVQRKGICVAVKV